MCCKGVLKSRLQRLSRTEAMQQRRRKAGAISFSSNGSNNGSGAIQNSYGIIRQESPGTSSMDLLRRELAIMKKLDHPNIVNLIEVLDDPHGDSLYMIIEWCEKGVIMPPDYTERNLPSPYTEDECRLLLFEI